MSKFNVTWGGAVRLLLVGYLPAVAGCATIPAAPPAAAPRISAEALASGLAEADRLASRGCYLCLREAAAEYSRLIALSDEVVLAAKALENNLMIALREIELRIPDSGARDAAHALQARVPASYASYFAVLDTAADSAAERRTLAEALEKESPASAMKSYFYIAAALNAGLAKELMPGLDGILSPHPQDLSLKYRVQAFGPAFSSEVSRALIGQETGFGEVHLLLGGRAVMNGNLPAAHNELTRARQLLPDSASVASVLAGVNMSYARYAEALTLYEQVTAAWPDEAALIGKAKALSYLTRHEEAIAMLDELLKNSQYNPGEKYYWRAWNRFRLDQNQTAYDDALAALNAMRNDAVYRLAGIVSLRLQRVGEARGYFENALQMNAADCVSITYLGQIDAAERIPKQAFVWFSNAVACYNQKLERMGGELARHEKDITGLSNGLIAGLRVEIKEAQALRAAALKHVDALIPDPQSRIPAAKP